MKMITSGSGVWLQKEDKTCPTPIGDSDCHIYFSEDFGIVLGQNWDYEDQVDFTDLCVVLKDDNIYVQYADPITKEAKFRQLDKGIFYKLFIRFLEDCKNYSNY